MLPAGRRHRTGRCVASGPVGGLSGPPVGIVEGLNYVKPEQHRGLMLGGAINRLNDPKQASRRRAQYAPNTLQASETSAGGCI